MYTVCTLEAAPPSLWAVIESRYLFSRKIFLILGDGATDSGRPPSLPLSPGHSFIRFLLLLIRGSCRNGSLELRHPFGEISAIRSPLPLPVCLYRCLLLSCERAPTTRVSGPSRPTKRTWAKKQSRQRSMNFHFHSVQVPIPRVTT